MTKVNGFPILERTTAVNKTIEDLQSEDEARRATTARGVWINWRMRDVPPIYQELMPYSYHAKVLWEAERCIRSQFEEDQKLAKSPWRQVGPEGGSMFCWDGVKPNDKIAIGMETSIPIGLSDAPKPGRWNDPDVIAAFEAAKSTPEFQRAVEYSKAWEELEGARRVFSEARETGADDETLRKLGGDLEAASQKVNRMADETPKLKSAFGQPPLSEYGKPNNWRK